MAEYLPARRALYKKTTYPDNAWAEAVDGEFQAEQGVEYEICCVGPSKSRFVSFTAATSTNTILLESGDELLLESGDEIFLESERWL